MAAAGEQGEGGLDQEEEEEEKEEVARVVPAARVADPHQMHQDGCPLVTTTIPSLCQKNPSNSATGAQAPLAHVSGAGSLLAHQETLHFWKDFYLKHLQRD